jgi:RsiW-degrading membrane proteinase PrsW (M82 family)
MVRVIASVLPVASFLVALVFLDSYKLVKLKSITFTICTGVAAALISYLIGGRLQLLQYIDGASYSRYIAPLVEELLKAGYIIYLISSKKLGFTVDAAIHGFALGAGFAIAENIYYLHYLTESSVFVWIIRGFGTAVMHGGATALFAVIAQDISERYGFKPFRILAAGVPIAYLIHALYNHFFLSPVLSAVGIMIMLPLLMISIFRRSERALQSWLGIGFDTDAELLEMITSGNITRTRIGQYLISLKTKFPGESVADMLCLVRIHVELAIRAKGILLMREAGFEVKPDPEIRAKFEEMDYLEKSIGRTGHLAVMPVLHWSRRDLWQLYMLGKK